MFPNSIQKLILLLVVTTFLSSAHASKIRQAALLKGVPSLPRDGHKTRDRDGRPALLRSTGQRNLQVFTDAEDEQTLRFRGGRPNLLRSAGMRHLQEDEKPADTDGEGAEGETENESEDAEGSGLGLTLDDVKDEMMEVANTPMEEWTTGQKVGVAIGALVGFVILFCLFKCLCCR